MWPVSCFLFELLIGSAVAEDDLDGKKDGHQIQEGMDFTIFSGTDFYERIQDEACAHTQGNAIGQWHEKNREEGRESFGDVPPMDIQQAFAHQGTDQD